MATRHFRFSIGNTGKGELFDIDRGAAVENVAGLEIIARAGELTRLRVDLLDVEIDGDIKVAE